MMELPVRKLSFKAKKNGYKLRIDADLEKAKAEFIADILRYEDIKALVYRIDEKHATLMAKGTVTGISMRRIIEVLAQ